MRRLSTLCAAVLMSLNLAAGAASAAAQEETGQRTYQDHRAELIELYNAERFEEAAALIEKEYDMYPGEEWKMSFNMALVCGHLKQYEKGIRYLEMALDKGQFFNSWAFRGEMWAPWRELDAFETVLERSEEMRAEAQKDARMELDVVMPEGAVEGRTYPLFIALHGGGENIGAFKPHWTSGTLQSEFIVAFVQSSQVVSMNGFSWEEQETTKKELGEAYEMICAGYPVDTSEVLIGGFSSGGYGSLVAAFFEAVPVKGFIILCPPMPDNITAAEVLKAKERGVRGTIMTTELDRRVPDQRKMADLFRENGLQYQFVLTPDIGHWYPDDLPAMIDQAIAHIRND